MSTKYSYELIKDYLDGMLDSKTSRIIESQLKDDETAKAIAKGILILEKRFNNDDTAIELYLSKRLKSQKEVVDKSQRSRRSNRWLAIAASISIIITSGILLYQRTQPTLENLVEKHLSQPYPASATVRSSQEDQELNKALEAFDNKDYQLSITLLKGQAEPRATFFKGLCHLHLKDYPAASSEFTKAEMENSRFQEQGRWYLALTYLEANDKKAAFETLTTIKEQSNHYKRQEAIQLIRMLD